VRSWIDSQNFGIGLLGICDHTAKEGGLAEEEEEEQEEEEEEEEERLEVSRGCPRWKNWLRARGSKNNSSVLLLGDLKVTRRLMLRIPRRFHRSPVYDNTVVPPHLMGVFIESRDFCDSVTQNNCVLHIQADRNQNVLEFIRANIDYQKYCEEERHREYVFVLVRRWIYSHDLGIGLLGICDNLLTLALGELVHNQNVPARDVHVVSAESEFSIQHCLQPYSATVASSRPAAKPTPCEGARESERSFRESLAPFLCSAKSPHDGVTESERLAPPHTLCTLSCQLVFLSHSLSVVLLSCCFLHRSRVRSFCCPVGLSLDFCLIFPLNRCVCGCVCATCTLTMGYMHSHNGLHAHSQWAFRERVI